MHHNILSFTCSISIKRPCHLSCYLRDLSQAIRIKLAHRVITALQQSRIRSLRFQTLPSRSGTTTTLSMGTTSVIRILKQCSIFTIFSCEIDWKLEECRSIGLDEVSKKSRPHSYTGNGDIFHQESLTNRFSIYPKQIS